jgi:hypothetical protein
MTLPRHDRVMRLIVGAGTLDRELDEADELLVSYRSDDGLRYLDFDAVTPVDSLLPEDLAVTILINSRVGPSAFKSVQDCGHALDLPSLPVKQLEETSEDERQAIAEVVGAVAPRSSRTPSPSSAP